MYVQNFCQCGVLVFHHQYYKMYASGTSEVRVDIKSVGFELKLYLVKGIIGGNIENSGESRFGNNVLR